MKILTSPRPAGSGAQNNSSWPKTMMMRLQISVASVAEESYDNCASSRCLPEFGCDHDKAKRNSFLWFSLRAAVPSPMCVHVGHNVSPDAPIAECPARKTEPVRQSLYALSRSEYDLQPFGENQHPTTIT